jgi:hypothetical protein
MAIFNRKLLVYQRVTSGYIGISPAMYGFCVMRTVDVYLFIMVKNGMNGVWSSIP